jgi:alkanesulfonate monooxygenase SsuD/methylene tetrahydromethanopterin reductase-like flavin-dependent oxidoreductase (luciferase family)
MIFSMIFEAQIAGPTPESEQQTFRDCVEQAVLGEEIGLDRIWAVEHHALVEYAHMSAPEVFLSFVAARTSRIRIGHGVVCAPFRYNHPVRIAERTATLDILSNGRLDVGFGRGATPRETGTFGITAEDTQVQLDEVLHMLPGIWTDDEFSYSSDTIEIPPRNIVPKPQQRPHPPLFMACTKEATLEMAGSLGVGALALGFAGPDDIAEKNKVYRAAVARRQPGEVAGKFANDHLSALCPAIVLDDAARARQVGFSGQRFFMESLNQWSRGGPKPEPATYGDSEQVLKEQSKNLEMQFGSELVKMTDATERRDAEQKAGMHLTRQEQAYGTPADCIAYVQRLIDAGADEIMFLIQMGTVPQEVCLETIRNIGTYVLPHFRALEEANTLGRTPEPALS